MTDNDNMLSNLVDPLILEIYLYKNNYKDRLLISELKEKARTVKVPGMETNSFFVNVEDMVDILHGKFEKDIIELNSTSSESLANNVTSIYFIESMLNAFDKIRYFKICVSDAQNFSRKVNDTINFDFKVIHAKIDFTTFCTDESLEIFTSLFKKVGLYKTEKYEKCPYFEAEFSDIVTLMINYQNGLAEEDPDILYVEDLFTIFGSKVEKDNPVVLVVVER